MASRQERAALRQLGTLFNLGAIRGLTDGQLLERFTTGRGEVAELAFAALVERHGATVLRVCRARLADAHDAEDAFQATFLVLVEKARGLWVEDSLAPWLHRVAVHTASCARATAARRRRHELRAAEQGAMVAGATDDVGFELAPVLHEEINRLPDRYRVPIVLCDLEGKTCEEAARQMGRPVGTVKSWRARGRERLRSRLVKVGLAPAAGGFLAAAETARAAVTEESTQATTRAAVRALSDRLIAGEVPASVNTLVQGVLTTMLLGKLRMTAATVLALAALAAGAGAIAQVARETKGEARASLPAPGSVPPLHAPSGPARDPEGTPWSLTLRDAIKIGLDRSEALRVLQIDDDGMPIKIAPLAAVDPLRFQAEVMAHLRSIEQQYWSLSQQHVQLWSSEKAVELAEEIKKREESELKIGRGTAAAVAEATQRLEQFRLNLVAKTSDVITTERQLRNILGLPAVDGRRIVPATPPSEAKVSPDWEDCLKTMLARQPDLLEAKARLTEAETLSPADVLELVFGRVSNESLPDPAGTGNPPRLTDAAQRRLALLQQRKEAVQQRTQRAIHSLARFYLEIDANYKQFKTASRLRAAAAQRLEAQRAFYEEGRCTIDRYLDAVSQYASAVAQEAQSKTTYNISIVALEEAKGTLLTFKNIAVSQGPPATAAAPLVAAATRDNATRPAALEAPASPSAAPAPQAIDATPKTRGARQTFSFQMTIGNEAKPIEIRGSITLPVPNNRESNPDEHPKN